MLRWRIVVSILVGSVLLALPTTAPARCYGSDTASRCGPLISESLLRRYLGLPNRYTPTTPRRYRYEGNTFTAPSTGATIHRYRYKDGLGNMYHGKIESLPGGTVRHWGSRR